MAILTEQQLRDTWVDGFEPSGQDYTNLIDSLYNIINNLGSSVPNIQNVLIQGNTTQGNTMVFDTPNGKVEVLTDSIVCTKGQDTISLKTNSTTNKGVVEFGNGSFKNTLTHNDSLLNNQKTFTLPKKSGVLGLKSDSSETLKSYYHSADVETYYPEFLQIGSGDVGANKILFPKGLFVIFDFTNVVSFIDTSVILSLRIGNSFVVSSHTLTLQSGVKQKVFLPTKDFSNTITQADYNNIINKSIIFNVEYDSPVDGTIDYQIFCDYDVITFQ